MINQLSLLDTGAMSRRTDPDSSRQAARRHEQSGRLDSDRWRVLEALRRNPGASSKELAAREGLDRHMVARRLPDLERAGLVRRDCDGKGDTRWYAIR